MARILIIEDDAAHRAELSTYLRQANYTVREAENGLLALRTFGLQPAELVITDMMMPVMDGVETIEVLRKQFPDVKIIAMSDHGLVSAEMCLRLAERLGAHRTLVKPFPAHTLLGTISELLETA
jgi:CheY-like chemotaxis protein